MDKTQQRFWDKVNKNGPTQSHMDTNCWEWESSCTPDGYGKFKIDRKTKGAHRVAFELENGSIKNGLQCLHNCDNTKCVRVSHLYLGTHSNNMKDRAERGDYQASLCWRSGSNHFNAKITEKDVLEIRKLYALGGITQKKLGNQFGLKNRTICSIVNKETWKHI